MNVLPMCFAQPVQFAAEHRGYIYGILRDLKMPEVDGRTRRRRAHLSLEAAGAMLGEAYAVWCRSCGSHQQDLPNDLLLQFLNLRQSDGDSALDFVRRYGLFDEADTHLPCLSTQGSKGRRHRSIQRITGPSGVVLEFSNRRSRSLAFPRHIREYWRAAQVAGNRPFATRLSQLWSEQQMLLFLWDLADAVKRKDWRFVKRAYSTRQTLPALTGPDATNPGAWLYVGSIWLQNELALRSAWRIGLGLSGISENAAPYLVTSSVRPALNLALICHLAEKADVGHCEQCGGLFVVSRPKKRFCSNRCQALAKVHRYRAKIKGNLENGQ